MSFPRLMRILLLLLILTAALGWLAWGRLLASQGISELSWQGLDLSRAGLALDSLQMRREGADGSRLALQAQQLFLSWPGTYDGQRQFDEFRARMLQVSWQPGTQIDPQPTDPQAWLDSLHWIPRRVDVAELFMDLPCAAGRCALRGGLQLDRTGPLATLNADLSQGERQMVINASARQNDGEWQLTGEASFDGKPWLTLDSRLQANTVTPRWSGSLQVARMADTRLLFLWLNQWLPADERLLHAEAALRFATDWQLVLAAADDPLDLRRLQHGSGTFNLQVRLQSPRISQQSLQMKDIDVDLRLHGQLADERLRLALQAPSSVALSNLGVAEVFTAKALRAELAGLVLHVGDPQRPLLLEGPLRLGVGSLLQAQVHPLGWQFKGDVKVALDRQTLGGTLSNDAGMSVVLQGNHERSGELALAADLGEIFFRAGNPLSKTLVAWPPLLEFANGRLVGAASLRSTPSKALNVDLGLQLKGLDGIYDRSELSGLAGRLDMRLRGQQLTLETSDLSLQQANPGLPVGPLQFRGRYAATLDQPVAGQLSWSRAHTGLFKGEAWLEPGQIDLGQPSQRLLLNLKGLQLDEIFRVYPAEGLAGRGSLTGELPMSIDARGVRIERGVLGATAPGYLQFRSEKIRALGRSNPSMQLVADALDDFHYDLLDSSVGYDERGKLTLALRLQGRNPDLEKGRPINLNVNLEEDVPALLTSLQLTDKVSETIRQRVQERLRQRNVPAP
ncbi:YdbH domain-containing protein [Pseudomonas sp. PDM16]|uniref:YdbH domain-containing protein n=1 Tax=Pseudomonas sp. PDM16 TaxID=2769292 RepID=UPI00177CAAB6|nr:YdbH domain-containing protein [Pseudomonas sp. PDM16]MBD9413691.1 YdbH domain-containing protein [Pseudomonas sp. PDM16]